MSNDVIKGEVVFSCDDAYCDETFESGERRYEDANVARRLEGWIAYKDEETGEWCHRCPTCSGARRG